MIETILSRLEQRLGGRVYARQRLGIETDHEAQIFGQELNFFHIENWYSIHSVIRILLKLTGLYWRGQANAANVCVKDNNIRSKTLPSEFDGFTLLQISDFHADMNDGAMRRLEEILSHLTTTFAFLPVIIAGRRSDRLTALWRVCGRFSAHQAANLWRAWQPRHDSHGAGSRSDGNSLVA